MSNSISEIRQTFLDFFHSKGHQIVESSSLVPDKDLSLLFTNAGMNQFKDVFLGMDNRFYRRAATSQRCVRAGGKHNDLTNVGYTVRHHTFFEMLGNFSFSDYFKYEAISFAWELLTGKQWFNLPAEKFLVTVYATDDETYNIWAKEIGIPTDYIIRIGDNKGIAYASDNFWQMGDTGPCGPCSEIFYDHGSHIYGGLPGSLEADGDRYIEIWNLVFIQFNRKSDGTLLPLQKPSVDTGMGLERIAAVLQNVNSNYEIDMFKRLIAAAAQIIGTNDIYSKSLLVIADHIRASAFLISDGVLPSNEGRGYVLRRIIRRAIRHGNILGVRNTFFYKLVSPLIDVMGKSASEIQLQQKMVEQVLRIEEEQFACTLERGITILDYELAKLTGDTLNGEIAFRLYDTYGFPLDLTIDICRERNLLVDKAGFERAMEEQRKRTRDYSCFSNEYNTHLSVNKKTYFIGYEYLEHPSIVISLFRDDKPVDIIRHGEEAIVVLDKTPFYGESSGQVGDSGILILTNGKFEVVDTQKYGKAFGHHGKLSYGELKLGTQVIAQVDSVRRECICLNHSSTHLLYAALRQVLGNHVRQKGSLVNEYGLRFDFSHNIALKPDQIRLIENIVNEQIRYNVPITAEIMALEEARNKGAIALFNDKYQSIVRVLSISDFSIELCSGTHTSRTGNIGVFLIIAESGTASGVRRIEAVTGKGALELIYHKIDLVQNLKNLMKCDNKNLLNKVQALKESYHKMEKEIKYLKIQQAMQKSASLVRNVRNINGVKVLVSQIDSIEPTMLRTIVDDLKNKLGSAVIILTTVLNGKISLIVGVTNDLIYRVKANEIARYFAQQVNGNGGGRPDLAQAGGSDIKCLPAAMENVDLILNTIL